MHNKPLKFKKSKIKLSLDLSSDEGNAIYQMISSSKFKNFLKDIVVNDEIELISRAFLQIEAAVLVALSENLEK